jgi:hypothetical protein
MSSYPRDQQDAVELEERRRTSEAREAEARLKRLDREECARAIRALTDQLNGQLACASTLNLKVNIDLKHVSDFSETHERWVVFSRVFEEIAR